MCNVKRVTSSVVSPDTAVPLSCTEHFSILYTTRQVPNATQIRLVTSW